MIAAALRRRADAARRMPPLEGRWGPDLGARDPHASWTGPILGPLRWDPAHAAGRFGLSDGELRAHARYLVDSGFQPWEIVAVLAKPEPVDA